MTRPPPSVQMAVPPSSGEWLQVPRLAIEKWAELMLENPRAAAVLGKILSRMGRHNALVVSQKTLAELCNCTDRTIRTAIKVLKERGYLEVRQIGPTGTACAYVVNSRVAWSGKRDGIRYALFEAAVLVSDADQPDRDEIGMLPPLESIPALYRGEQQLPVGDGLPPPSQPALPGMEPDLPARQMDIEDYTG